MSDDKGTQELLTKSCDCGSGKRSGECCMSASPCWCGSEQEVSTCHMAPGEEKDPE